MSCRSCPYGDSSACEFCSRPDPQHLQRGELQPGFIYAPYIPPVITPVDIESMFPARRGIMRRYAEKTIDRALYGRAAVSQV